MSNGGRDLVFGEAADSSGTGLGYLAICEQPVGGTGSASDQTYSAITGCTSSTTSADWIEIYGGSGGDRIGPLTSTTGTISCGTGGNKIKPYAWSFPMAAAGLGGFDVLFGTPHADLLVSNTFSQSSPADGSPDVLCGYGGNDWLIGDSDDNTPAGAEECLDGGSGTGDVCEAGNAGMPDTNAGDLYSGCETTTGSFRSSSANCYCSGYGYESFWVSP